MFIRIIKRIFLRYFKFSETLENGVEEENKQEKHMLIVTTPDWLDLPDPIATNIILEHLDIVDYIRFSAVCKKWQTIQKEHQIRHSPYPPHLPRTFPWLSCMICFYEKRTFHFYLTNKQKAYNIPLYEKARVRKFGYRYGWLLMRKVDKFSEWLSFCILNPITGVQIESPMFKKIIFQDAYISSPPTDPDCTIVALDFEGNVYLCRINDNSSLIKTDYTIHAKGKPFFCHNKIYKIEDCEIIYMVDALLPDPIEQMIEMDCSDVCVVLPYILYLVDFLGELIMVMVVYHEIPIIEIDYPSIKSIKEFRVYRADFSTNKWMRMESLGDHALFFSHHSIFSLPADDVGCEKNTIYFPGVLEANRVALVAFNLNTRNWIGGRSMAHLNRYHQFFSNWIWFLPTLDYYNVTKTNGAC